MGKNIISTDPTAIQISTNTLDVVFDRWINFIDVKEKTAETYKKAMKNFLRYTAGNGISDPDREDVKRWRDTLKAEGRTPATINTYRAAIKVFFKWASYEGHHRDITVFVKSVKDTRDHKKDPLTNEQAADVLNTIDRSTVEGKRDFAMVLLMIETGCRTIEVSRANVEDYRNGVLYVQGKGRDGKDTTKNIKAALDRAIRDYLAARGKVDEKEPLFVGHCNRNRGQRLTTRTISGIAKDALKDAHLDNKRLTAHSFRHTTATMARQNGAELDEVRQALGHADIKTTQIYDSHISAINNRTSQIVEDCLIAAGARI